MKTAIKILILISAFAAFWLSLILFIGDDSAMQASWLVRLLIKAAMLAVCMASGNLLYNVERSVRYDIIKAIRRSNQ